MSKLSLLGQLARATVLASLLCPLLSLAAPINLELNCENAGGVWDDSLETLCAPCNLCLSSEGELREDSLYGCTAECRPWCQCPEGMVFYNYTECVPEAEYPVTCQDENPQAMVCLESGGDWTSCVDTCSYCLTDSGTKTPFGFGCPEVCQHGCACPEGQSPSDEGCKPNEDVLPLCSDIENEEPLGGREEGNGDVVEEGSSCDQISGVNPLWILALLLLIFAARKGDAHFDRMS